MKRKGHYTIVDTYNATDNYTKECYKEFLDEWDEDYDENDEHAYMQWAEEQAWQDFSDFLDNLRYSNLYGRAVIIEGSLGLWWGRPDIEQRFFEDPIEAIKACASGSYDVILKKVGHKLELENLHHDGRNCFTVTFLTPLGEQRFVDHGRVSTQNRENFIKLPEFLF